MAVFEQYVDAKAYHERLRIRTEQVEQFIDLTEWVIERVRRSGVVHGRVRIDTPHEGTALAIDDTEPLWEDELAELLSPAPAEAQALRLGPSQTLRVVDGRLRLGECQTIYLVESDGPGPREVTATVTGVR